MVPPVSSDDVSRFIFLTPQEFEVLTLRYDDIQELLVNGRTVVNNPTFVLGDDVLAWFPVKRRVYIELVNNQFVLLAKDSASEKVIGRVVLTRVCYFRLVRYFHDIQTVLKRFPLNTASDPLAKIMMDSVAVSLLTLMRFKNPGQKITKELLIKHNSDMRKMVNDAISDFRNFSTGTYVLRDVREKMKELEIKVEIDLYSYLDQLMSQTNTLIEVMISHA